MNKFRIAEQAKVFGVAVILSGSVIALSSRATVPEDIDPRARCFFISEEDRKSVGIPSDQPVIIVRPHGCQSCTRDNASLIGKARASKVAFFILMDSDVKEEDIVPWRVGPNIKVLKRDAVPIALRKISLGIYHLTPDSTQACWMEEANVK